MKIEINKGQLMQIQLMLSNIKNGAPRAISSAINKTLPNIKTQAAKEIGAILNLSSERIKKDFSIKKSSWSDLSGEVKATGAPVGLAHFGPVDSRFGVWVKVKKRGKQELLRHAFLASGKKGIGLHVWWRGRHEMPQPKRFWGGVKSAAPWQKFGKKYQFPPGPKENRGIMRLTGPRIEDIYASDVVYQPVHRLAVDRFAENLDKQVSEVLRRFG